MSIGNRYREQQLQEQVEPSSIQKKAFSVMTPLHDRAAASLLLRSIRILALVNLGLCQHSACRSLFFISRSIAYLAPYRRYHKITSIVAVVDQPGQRTVCEHSGQVRTAVGNWITTIPSLIIDESTGTMTVAKAIGIGHLRHGSLGHLHSRTIQILL
jgi:hypothetical protein